MNNEKQKDNIETITLKGIITKFSTLFAFLKSKWIRISIVALVFSLIGLLLSIIQKDQYVSKVTFVVEDSKSSGGGLASIAGQFGIDIGGGSGGGIFNGDNILLFLRSESLCRQMLRSNYAENDSTVSLADVFVENSGLKTKWVKKLGLKDLKFASNKKLSKTEDSLLNVVVKEYFLKKNIAIYKPDKKASFVDIRVVTGDEKLSLLSSIRLVEIATERYIQSKTKVKLTNVNNLQRRADSLAQILDNKIIYNAGVQQSLVDINPALRSIPAAAEIAVRDKNMIGTIFAEVVKNLEISKTLLSQETPVIQIVDMSSSPLERLRPSKIKYMLTWFMIGAFGYSMYLLVGMWFRNLMR
jgi:hypothetical protein